MEHPELPRYELASSRRRFLTRAAAFGAAVAVPGALAACGTDDESALGSTSTAAKATSSTSAADATTTTAAGAATTAAGSATTGAANGTALPAGASLDVAFTYTVADSMGPARNPYIAVWVQDTAGALVATLSLWYNPPKGDRWINHLTSWYTIAADSDPQAVTSATRPAGTYTVTWDGTDDSGQRVTAGEYLVFVESAREHGDESVTSTQVTLGDQGVTVKAADAGELSKVSVTYKA